MWRSAGSIVSMLVTGVCTWSLPKTRTSEWQNMKRRQRLDSRPQETPVVDQAFKRMTASGGIKRQTEILLIAVDVQA